MHSVLVLQVVQLISVQRVEQELTPTTGLTMSRLKIFPESRQEPIPFKFWMPITV